MNQWYQDLLKILKYLGGLLAIIILLFIVNQFWLLFQLLSQFHYLLAWIITILLIGFIAYWIFQLYKLWRHTPVLTELNENPTEQEYQDYLQESTLLLTHNPHLSDFNFNQTNISQEELLSHAIDHLDSLSNPIIRSNASAIFLSTAISQNGSLDSVMVLFSLVRMIWQLANIYRTRPTLSSLLKLYIQVGSVVLMARTIEDADLIESQIEPLIATIIGESIASAIPGMVPITNLIVSSLMEGSVNALLTLRVGIIAQSYLSLNRPTSQQNIKKSATAKSLIHMGGILKENSTFVIKTIANATKNASIGKAKKWFSF